MTFGHRGQAAVQLIPIRNLGAGILWVVSYMLRPLYSPKKGAVPIVQESGWALGPVRIGTKNLAPLVSPVQYHNGVCSVQTQNVQQHTEAILGC